MGGGFTYLNFERVQLQFSAEMTLTDKVLVVDHPLPKPDWHWPLDTYLTNVVKSFTRRQIYGNICIMTWQTCSKAKMESWNFVTTDMSLHFASSYFFPLEHLDLLSTLKCGLRVFEKCYLWHFRYEILIWWTWTWNSLKNTWATEPLI